MIHAYDKNYLEKAQALLGRMLDFAVYDFNVDVEKFYKKFCDSEYARRFEIGDTSLLSGKSGVELAYDIIGNSTVKPKFTTNRSPEYWAGWALAYYQWKSGQSFRQIDHAVSIDTVCAMYDPLHEADIEKFVYIMNEKLEQQDVSRLRRLRTYAKLSQRQLAEAADVPVRQIQLFDQGERDINKTQGMTLLKLSRVLKCRPEELLAYVDCL